MLDDRGRQIHFRGVNLPAKSPPFKPFELIDAPYHFRKLRNWGFNLVRLVTPWESIEPHRGVYEDDYCEYVEKFTNAAKEYGIYVIIDAHQDCCSRFSGGSGFPLWAFELVGLDHLLFEDCIASVFDHGGSWPVNYTKYASLTMFTLFFGSETFAPSNLFHVQSELQHSYIAAYVHLARRLKACSNLLGFDVMNEPHHGYIVLPTLQRFSEDVNLHLGLMPSPLQGMRLAEEASAERVGVWKRSWPWPTRRYTEQLVQPRVACSPRIWRNESVYDDFGFNDTYFAGADFEEDFYLPFVRKFQHAIQSVRSSIYILVEPVPNALPLKLTAFSCSKIIYSPHFYDLRAIFEKRFNSFLSVNVQALTRGSRNLLRHTYFSHSNNYEAQLTGLIHCDTKHEIILGEVGVPFNLATPEMSRTIYRATITALENSALQFCLWCYAPLGESWNQEAFSISDGQASDLWCRPYVSAAGGKVVRTRRSDECFMVEFEPDRNGSCKFFDRNTGRELLHAKM